MSNLTLADLRTYGSGDTSPCYPDGCDPSHRHQRKTSPQDLSSVLASLTDEQLAEMGGERLPEATIRDKRGRYRNGSYLVIPIPEDS